MLQILSTSLGKSKWKVLCPVVTTSLLSPICTPIIIMTWLSCYKVFWWLYCVDTKGGVFVWFCFLFCMNYSQVLFVLIILGSLVNSLFGGKIFNLFPYFTSSPLSVGGMIGTLTIYSSTFSFLVTLFRVGFLSVAYLTVAYLARLEISVRC